MTDLIEIAFRYIPIGEEFGHEGQIYIKTNFNRGYYFKGSKTIHKVFKKKILVKTTREYFNMIGWFFQNMWYT